MQSISLFCWLVAVTHPSVLVHPVHETVTEIEWNAGSGRLEVAIRLDADDERWIREKMNADVDANVSDWAIEYLKKRFRVADLSESKSASKAGIDPTTYHWIGRDRDGAYAWWYFEIDAGDRRRPEWFDHQVLFDREPDFLHRVLILDGTPPTAINVTGQRTRVSLKGP